MNDQKPKRKRGLYWLLGVIVVGVALFFLGPVLIHSAYRLGATENDMRVNMMRYERLVLLGSKAKGPVKTRMDQERMEIYYWYHSRGWTLDEEKDESLIGRTIRDWRNLAGYWGFLGAS